MGRKRSLSVDEFTERFNVDRSGRERRRAERLMGRFAKATFAQYQSDIEYIRRCSEKTNHDSLDQQWFSAFIDIQLSSGTGAEVVGRMKAAYRVWLVINGQVINEVIWSSLGWEISGVRRMAAEFKSPRGAIGFDKLIKVIQVSHELGHELYTAGLLLAFSACLRHTQIMTLTVSDVLFDQREVADVVLRLRSGNKGKGNAARTSYPRTAFGCKKLLGYVTQQRGDAELLFPFWDRKIANWVIKTTALKEGWDCNQTWGGVHCIRHGARITQDTSLDTAMKLEMRKGGWKSVSACVWYSRI